MNEDKLKKILDACLAILAGAAAFMSVALAAYMFMTIFGLMSKGG